MYKNVFLRDDYLKNKTHEELTAIQVEKIKQNDDSCLGSIPKCVSTCLIDQSSLKPHGVSFNKDFFHNQSVQTMKSVLWAQTST